MRAWKLPILAVAALLAGAAPASAEGYYMALHGGAIPGYPASHGCVRLPHGFAPQLFEMTSVGENVVVIGAGNTAIDVATEAVRLGADNVTIVYRRTSKKGTDAVCTSSSISATRSKSDGPCAIAAISLTTLSFLNRSAR